MKRTSVYLTEENQHLLALLLEETGTKSVSELITVSMKVHARALGFRYEPPAPARWVRGCATD